MKLDDFKIDLSKLLLQHLGVRIHITNMKIIDLNNVNKLATFELNLEGYVEERQTTERD
jgi:hypothetical protein